MEPANLGHTIDANRAHPHHTTSRYPVAVQPRQRTKTALRKPASLAVARLAYQVQTAHDLDRENFSFINQSWPL